MTQAATAEAAVAAPELELEGSIFLLRSEGGGYVLSVVNVSKLLTTGTFALSPPSLFGLYVDPSSPDKLRLSDKETS